MHVSGWYVRNVVCEGVTRGCKTGLQPVVLQSAVCSLLLQADNAAVAPGHVGHAIVAVGGDDTAGHVDHAIVARYKLL